MKDLTERVCSEWSFKRRSTSLCTWGCCAGPGCSSEVGSGLRWDPEREDSRRKPRCHVSPSVLKPSLGEDMDEEVLYLQGLEGWLVHGRFSMPSECCQICAWGMRSLRGGWKPNWLWGRGSWGGEYICKLWRLFCWENRGSSELKKPKFWEQYMKILVGLGWQAGRVRGDEHIQKISWHVHHGKIIQFWICVLRNTMPLS